jgi:hypothetical protein
MEPPRVPDNPFQPPAVAESLVAPPGSRPDAVTRMMLPVGRSGWAIAAGYLGLFAVLIVPAPLALICGILALRDFKRHPEKFGRGRAIFGLAMGGLGTLILIPTLVAMIAG